MSPPLTIIQPRIVLDDPHACTDSSDVLGMFGALFDALVARGADGWEPGLAESWTISDDARTTRFVLRPGLRFHDGEACDADAVRYCLERMARPDMGATLGAPGVYAQYLAGLTVKVENALRLSVTTVEPTADILDVIGAGAIVSPRALEAAGDDLARRAVGTGPFTLKAYTPGERIEMQANPGHFAGAPRQDSLLWIAGALPDERRAALLTGRAGIANGLEHASEPLPADGFTAHEYLSPTALILMFNCARGPGTDPRVRRALNLAIDREALVRDVLHGAGQPLHGFVSPAHHAHDPDAPGFTRDLAEARRLLAEAGHGCGLQLDIYCPTRLPDEAPALVDAIEAQLAGLGVTFNRKVETDRTRYANQVRLKNIHDICVFDSSPMSAFRVLHEKIDSRVKGSWWEGYRNAEVEALLDQARRTVDTPARLRLHRQVYRMLQQDPPWLYVYNHRRIVGLAGRHPGFAMRRDGVLDARRLPAI